MVVNKLYFGGSKFYFPLSLMDDFLKKLREKAVYFKLESKPKYGGGVGIDDVISVLQSLSESYQSFVDIEYNRINTQQDRKKLNKIKKGLVEENNLIIVDLTFSSFGSAVSPNIVTNTHTIPSIKDQPKWKKETFERYKDIVLKSDFNDSGYLKEIGRKYSPVDRQRIFGPIVDGIINNEKANTSFGFGSLSKLKLLSKPKKESYSILVPTPQVVDTPQEVRTSLAMVEIKGKTTKPKVLELFEEVKNPIYSFNLISFGDKTYSLKYPIYCELIHEDKAYALENKELGIYSSGKNIEEAQKSFFEEFDYIFTRYNSLPNSQLTDDVIAIKQLLNFFVK